MSNIEPGQTQDASPRRDEQSHGERRRRDPISAAMGGMVLILLGVVFLLAQSNLFGVTWVNMWGAFLMGLGGLLLIQALLRLVLPDYRRNVFGLVIGAFVLIAIGMIPFGGTDWGMWWPLALIAIGIVMLIGQFTRW